MSAALSADLDAGARYNLALSQRRVGAVADYLRPRTTGVRYDTDAVGENDPVTGNGTSRGMAQNRQVDIDVT